ncbi:hypothetical protein [Asticcacaulis sp. 201]|uniref:hypothetical protein n=1 Tax=Asticcacaulis sp. 201 TaxID=3028787 RepID=UPI002916B147|nr:hypothetical protein [Asticcacaulis sp. 201]MDV6329946.1 hypothetical protein [Asticcacaulis sp. 201]
MPNILPTPVHVEREVLLSAAPFIQPSQIDWGFLKLRSGQRGMDALTDIERHSPKSIMRQTSVAVQYQWYEKGHQFDCNGAHFCKVPAPLLHETRLDELRLPTDGMMVPRDLKPGQAIPENFWDSHRFRIRCLFPPKNWAYQTTECRLRMVDLDNDGKEEVILEQVSFGTMQVYLHPIVREHWEIYKQEGGEWRRRERLRFCVVDQAASHNARATVTHLTLDTLWFDGTPVNFFDNECMQDGDVDRPDAGLNAAAKMAGKMGQVHVIASGGRQIPASLIRALANRTVVQPSQELPPEVPVPGGVLGAPFTTEPRFKGLPPCFVANDPKGCVAVVADIDHDGADDVMIIDKPVQHGTVDYRLITLLMVKDGRWQVIANHAACSDDRPEIADAEVALKPSAWQPILFAGRLYVPSADSDKCQYHYSMI